MVAQGETSADCLGAWFGDASTVRGRVVSLEWGAPIPFDCPEPETRCFEAALGAYARPAYVRIVLADLEHRDRRGRTFKLKHLILDGVMPQQTIECHARLEPGQLRHFVVEPRTSAPWHAVRAI